MRLIDAVGRDWLEKRVDEALAEDLLEMGDITSAATVPDTLQGRAELVAKADGVLAGADWAVITGERTTPSVSWTFLVEDGTPVHKGDVLAQVTGPMRGILVAERTALNGLGHLSGIATASAQAMELVHGTHAVVIDTRKTTPGWRLAEKYAVRAGGAGNHRVGLYDEILIKENHVEAAGGVGKAVSASVDWRSRETSRASIPIEVEVTGLAELKEALAAGPDRVLLDNFSLDELRQAVQIAGDRVLLEASGGITLETLADVAATGVDRISLGALTHSVRPLDVSLLVRESTPGK